MSWQQRPSEDRVFFQVHGLPQLLKLKIASDSALHNLFEHIPTQKHQPPLCIDGPEFIWRDIVLDPLKTPEDYDMPTGERNVQMIQVNFPCVSPRTALNAMQARGNSHGDDIVHETPRGAPLSSRMSIDGDRRSPIPNSARAGESATPNASSTKQSPRMAQQPPAISVDKIIDDLTQALRGAEDEIDELQKRLQEKTRQVEALKPEKLFELEKENARLKTELDAERRENDSKQEAIQILRNKISALESAASRSLADNGSQDGAAGSHAAEALATSLRHHCHSLEGELANREDEIRQLSIKITSLQTELEVVRSSAAEDAKNHQETIQRLEATYVAQRKKTEENLDSEEGLRLRIDRLERENAILQSDNTTLAQRVVAAENNKTELRGLRNQHDIDTAAWNAQKNAYEKEIKALREKNADQLLQSQRHEKVLSERNAALQEKIAYFEDPRSVTQREEEYQQRELEMRSRLRDALAENDRLKTIHKDLKRQVSELETSLFECNNVLVRVQRENTDLKRAGVGFVASSGNTPREARLPASARTMASQQQYIGSPLPTAPIAASGAVANSKAADNALLHVDPFSLIRGSPADARGTSSPNVADALLLSRHGGNSFRGTQGDQELRSGSRSSTANQQTTPAAVPSDFQDA